MNIGEFKKRCTICKVDKEDKEFAKRRRQCTSCRNKLRNIWHQRKTRNLEFIERRRLHDRTQYASNPLVKQRQIDTMRRYRSKREVKDRINLYHKKLRSEYKERYSNYEKKYTQQAWIGAFLAYGGAICACCEEKERAFLSIDHINGGGGKHRREIAGSLIHWLKRNGYPTGYRILCMNCNWATRYREVCPHKQLRKENGYANRRI